MCGPCVAFPANRAELMCRADFSHGKSFEKVKNKPLGKRIAIKSDTSGNILQN
jgi:hypothetical protein